MAFTTLNTFKCDDVAFTTLNTSGVLYKYEHVTNNLACVLRTFQDILKIVW